MKSKLYSVRVPADEVEVIEAMFRHLPGASPALLFRAALLSFGKVGLVNAVAKHAAARAKGGKR